MPTDLYERLSWKAGLTLEERGRISSSTSPRAVDTPEAPLPTRADTWCAKRYLDLSEMQERLGLLDLTTIDLNCLTQFTALQPAEFPEWLAFLGSALLDTPPTISEHLSAMIIPRASFARVVRPLIQRAIATVFCAAEALTHRYNHAAFSPDKLVTLFLGELLERLHLILSPTLAEELSFAKEEGRLSGATPEDRFDCFIASLSTAETLIQLLSRYPVATRLVATVLLQWSETIIEFVERLAADYGELQSTLFAGTDIGPLSAVAGVGDRHINGRSVLRVTFESGARVAYKPRPLETMACFGQMLSLITKWEPTISIRQPSLIDRGRYGWVEWITKCDLSEPTAAHRFYYKQGVLLCLLYLLGGIDIHQENVIAAGDDPVLIDLEALFHPALPQVTSEPLVAAADALASSVMRIGLLPTLLRTDEGKGGVQLGGLASRGNQPSSDLPVWINEGTDELDLKWRPRTLRSAENMPTFNGGEVDLCPYVDDFIEGYKRAYAMVLTHQEDLAKEGGLLDAWGSVNTRVLLRHTEFYMALLRQSYHFSVMSDAFDRDELLDHLWKNSRSRGFMKSVFLAEHRDLWRDDVPLFTGRADSVHLRSSSGELTTDFFPESGLSEAKRRVLRFGEEDLGRQLWIIENAFASVCRFDPTCRGLSESLQEANCRSLPAPLDIAAAIGERLLSLGYASPSGAFSWLGLSPINGGGAVIRPIGPDLYDGTSGLALFFAYLGEVTKSSRYREVGRHLMAAGLAAASHRQTSIGFGTGVGGILYAVSHVTALNRTLFATTLVDGLVGKLEHLIDDVAALDIVDGAAGCIGGLLSYIRVGASSSAMDLCIRCADKICAEWNAERFPLAGFAHGAAGMAWALTEVWKETRVQKYFDRALGILQYERGMFRPDKDNWQDGSESRGMSKDLPIAWCHGAVGIGLSRISMMEACGDPQMSEEIEAAVRATVANGRRKNLSLCHGTCGSIELLREAQVSVLGGGCVAHGAMSTEVEATMRTGSRILASPGLMTGLAGVGYGMLRQASPTVVPSLLRLKPPIV